MDNEKEIVALESVRGNLANGQMFKLTLRNEGNGI